MSQRWLMAVLSQGLMTSSLVLSFVSPIVSVSKQKREAMCSMCDPTLPHRWGEKHTQEEKQEWASFLFIMFLLCCSCIKRRVVTQLLWPDAGKYRVPNPTGSRAHTEHFSHQKHNHLSSAFACLQKDNILLTAFSPGHWFKCQLSD